MHVIIEGIDQTGKSTLASAIATKLRMPVVNACRDTGRGRLADVMQELTVGGPKVFDRLHLSEMVYGPVLRGSCDFSRDDRLLIEAVCQILGTVNIYCYEPVAYLINRWDGLRAEAITVEQLPDIEAMYQDALTLSRLKWLQSPCSARDTAAGVMKFAESVAELLPGPRALNRECDMARAVARCALLNTARAGGLR